MDRSQALGIILGFALLAFLIYKLYADKAEEGKTTDADSGEEPSEEEEGKEEEEMDYDLSSKTCPVFTVTVPDKAVMGSYIEVKVKAYGLRGSDLRIPYTKEGIGYMFASKRLYISSDRWEQSIKIKVLDRDDVGYVRSGKFVVLAVSPATGKAKAKAEEKITVYKAESASQYNFSSRVSTSWFADFKDGILKVRIIAEVNNPKASNIEYVKFTWDRPLERDVNVVKPINKYQTSVMVAHTFEIKNISFVVEVGRGMTTMVQPKRYKFRVTAGDFKEEREVILYPDGTMEIKPVTVLQVKEGKDEPVYGGGGSAKDFELIE